MSRDNIYINTDERIFYLTDAIDENTLSRINFNILYILQEDEREEKKLKEYERKPIKLFINSPGGNTYDMWSLIDILLTSKTPIHTCCTGYAMSAAFMIFLAGSERIITSHATLMYHQLSGFRHGKYQDLVEDRAELDWIQTQIDEYVVERTKITKDDLSKNRERKQDWYFHGDDAIKYGVATRVKDVFDNFRRVDNE